ncbi:MAG: VCBS repeat-containing protein [Verrucomicrobiales bacterium]|nr:VCBS repeat-containing protein [Verrucomicrobiales bacterium]
MQALCHCGQLLAGTLLLGLQLLAANPPFVWLDGEGYRRASLPVPAAGQTGFTRLLADQTGITFTNVLPESRFVTNQVLPNGAGVAAGDVDNDGWCDLYFCGLNSPNRLYRNLGQWRFEDITTQAGVACPELDATGAVFADLDGDGDLDLIVNSIGGGTHLFLNDGRGRFTPGSEVLNRSRGGTSLALADADGDGDLDLYVANYRTSTLMDAPGTRFSVRMLDGQMVVASINGRPLTDPEWTNRFRFTIELGPGGRGKFAHEELGEADVLYRNTGGGRFVPVPWTDGTFLDEDGQALAEPPFDWGLSVAFRDFNGDGRPDLYVCNDFGTPDRFWLNDGKGRFRAAPRLALRQTSLASMAVDVADVNRDGHDDFLVVEMLSREHRRRLTQRNVVQGKTPSPAEIQSRPQYPRNTLFLNRGDGTYAELAQYAGLDASEWSWSPMFLDVDLDGYDDLLVTNGFERDNMNADVQARIQATRAAQRARTTEELQLRRLFPRLDTANLAFRNQGYLEFAEVGQAWGFDTPTISQGACLADLDNDGDLDVIVNNLNAAAAVYRNDGTAPRLAVRLVGLPPNTRGIGARLTVSGGPVPQSQVMTCGGRYLSGDAPLRVFAAGSPTNRLRLEVRWPSGRTSLVPDASANHLYEIHEAAAAAHEPGVQTSSLPLHSPVVRASSLPLHSPVVQTSSLPLHSPVVRASSLHPPRSMAPGQVNEDQAASPFPAPPSVAQPPSRPQPHPTAFAPEPVFDDVSHRLAHGHHDDPFDDFERQPLLPRRLGEAGPGVCWTDLDGDGWDDLVVGAGRGGQLACYRNDTRGGFQRLTQAPWNQTVTHDQTGIVAGAPGFFYVGTSPDEAGPSTTNPVQTYRTGEPPTAMAGVAAHAAGAGALALADYDGDSTLDLFVGGRALPGQYPLASPSRCYRQRDGQFVADEASDEVLRDVGLVNGAVWSDLDGDGWPELVLACEWGPVRVFRNPRGRLEAWNVPVRVNREPRTTDHGPRTTDQGPGTRDHEPVTGDFGLRTSDFGLRTSDFGLRTSSFLTLNALTGWWNGVATGDFDGDGRLDLLATNWGRNTKYERHRQHPLRLYHGDPEGTGSRGLLEAYHDPVLDAYVPARMLDTVAKAMPFLHGQFATHQAWAEASVSAVLGDRADRIRVLDATWLETTLFLNRGDHFEARVLPLEAQLSPAFAACVADYDGDGCEDLFLSQNFFGVDADTSRYDAGRGLWLQGDGHGGFRAVPGQESGVRVYGQQRGAAVADYDGDGRVDLVVAQHGAQTRLFRNTRGQPGLRVRLTGPAGNPWGIGAVVRLRFGERWGPAREVQAGAGYWGQNATTLVLGTPTTPTHVWVRWPGGQTQQVALPREVREIQLHASGRLQPLR